MIFQFISLGLLILLSAFFSGVETAFTSLSIPQSQELARRKGKRGKMVKKLLKRLDMVLITILIGNNLVNISASAIATQITIELFGSHVIGIMTGILTFTILIFSEVTPKRLAYVYNNFICLNTAYVLNFLSIILKPAICVIRGISSFMILLFRSERNHQISLPNIIHMINIAEGMGILESYENRMVKNIFRLNDITIKTIMTHRTNVFSLEMNSKIENVVSKIITKGYSRIPVYDKNPESIKGIVLIKDLVKSRLKSSKSTALKDIMLPPIFVSQTKKLNELLSQFKKEKLNMAIIIDEYGGLAGIVTLEDIIEEITGELYDENEIGPRKEKIAKIKKDVYLITGDTSLLQIGDQFDIEFPSLKTAKTIGGYLVECFDRIPSKNDKITTKEGKFIIEKVSGNRIETIRYIPARLDY